MAELEHQRIKEYIEERSYQSQIVPLSELEIKQNEHGYYIGRDAKLEDIDNMTTHKHPYMRVTDYSKDIKEMEKKLIKLKAMELKLRRNHMHSNTFHVKDGIADQIHDFKMRPAELQHIPNQGYFYGRNVEIDGQQHLHTIETNTHERKEDAIKEMAAIDTDRIIERSNISLEPSIKEPIQQTLPLESFDPEQKLPFQSVDLLQEREKQYDIELEYYRLIDPDYEPEHEPEQVWERADEDEPERVYDPEPEYEYDEYGREYEIEQISDEDFNRAMEAIENRQPLQERSPEPEQTLEYVDDYEPEHVDPAPWEDPDMSREDILNRPIKFSELDPDIQHEYNQMDLYEMNDLQEQENLNVLVNESKYERERADEDDHEPEQKSSSIGEPKHEREDDHEPSAFIKDLEKHENFINDLEKEHEKAIEELYEVVEMRIEVAEIER